MIITIEPLTKPTLTETHTNITCHDKNDGTITVTKSSGTANYKFSKDDGSNWVTPSPATAISYTFSSLSASTYKVRIKDGNGCVSDAKSVKINNPSAVTATPHATTPICLNDQTALSVTAGGGTGSGYTYQWSSTSTGAGLPSATNVQNITATPTTAGGKTYSVKVKDSNGCEGNGSVPVTVNAIPTVPTVTGNSRCGSGTVALSATVGANGTICRWYSAQTGGSPFATGPSYTTPSINSTTHYWVSSYHATTGCESGRVEVTATVNELPTVTISGTTSICQGSSTTLTASATGCSFAWSDGLGNSATTSPISAAGTYTVTATNTTTQCTNTKSETVTVNALPTVTISGTTSICQGSSTTLTASASDCSFAWSDDLGNSATTLPITETGTYTVTVTNTNTQCTNTASETVTVNALPTVTISGTTSICQGSSTTLTASASDCSFAWSDGLGNNATT